jgi:hypothetical protein
MDRTVLAIRAHFVRHHAIPATDHQPTTALYVPPNYPYFKALVSA